MKILPITQVKFNNYSKISKINFQSQRKDDYDFENSNVDKKVFEKRKIIAQNQNINSFFDDIALLFFKEDKKTKILFSNLLKQGKISLSSSAYKDLKNPQSAVGLKLNPENSIMKNCEILDTYIQKGVGVGINFSEFDNPSSAVKKINSYFKFRESSCVRPPAAIALLNIYNADILNFISLKDNEQYKDWCFDLSVIIDDDFLALVDGNFDVTLSSGKTVKAKKVYDKLLDSMLKKGEPGIIFSSSKDYICDCCAACELKENEKLTLGQINLSKFVKNSKFDFNSLKESAFVLNSAMKKLDENSHISILGYQDLLNQMNLKYGSSEAIELLGQIIKTIKSQNVKMALSPTGTISRFLKTSPSIEPDKTKDINYIDEIDTVAVVQKLIEGQVSKTICLKQNATVQDVDKIIRYSKAKGLKGISVFKN